jgi:protein-S-isoprenylcysteine O-methyltransferase Ste14
VSGTRIILGSLVGASIRHGIFTILLPWLILYRTEGMEEMRFDAGYPAVGWVLVLLGAVLYIRAFAERLRMTAMVTASPATLGSHGAVTGTAEETSAESPGRTADDDPAGDSRPVWSEGTHGWSRNPLLLGAVLILFGECLAFESLALLVYAVVYWAWLTLYLVFFEEPALRRALGDEYLHYCRHVPRWFLRIRFRRPA